LFMKYVLKFNFFIESSKLILKYIQQANILNV